MFEEKDIIKAWEILRKSKEGLSISSETFDFMKNVAIKELKKIKEYDGYLSFEDIVKMEGWYIADSFVDGVCIEISKKHEFYLLSFADKDDINPIREPISFYPGLLTKKYKRVFNRKELFRK